MLLKCKLSIKYHSEYTVYPHAELVLHNKEHANLICFPEITFQRTCKFLIACVIELTDCHERLVI